MSHRSVTDVSQGETACFASVFQSFIIHFHTLVTLLHFDKTKVNSEKIEIEIIGMSRNDVSQTMCHIKWI